MKTRPIPAVRFVLSVSEKFMREVLGHSHSLHSIDAESTVYDFGPFNPGEGRFLFERRVVGRAWRVFGVDISRVVTRPLCEIFYYIRLKLPDMPLPVPENPSEKLPFEKN